MKGYITNNIYVSPRNKNHWFIKYHGFAISESILNGLPERVQYVLFDYHGKEHLRYYIKKDKIKQVGKIHFNGIDDKQLAIDIDDMELIK